MTFWGVEVKPGKPFILVAGELSGSLILTQATLGLGKSPKKSILQVNVGDNKPIFICSLLPDILECFTLNLEFDEEDDVKFSVVGPTSIHLSGYVDRPKHDGDCELDCCGEDIAETESEHSEFEDEDEDDDGDDFINDEDMPMYPPSPTQRKGVVIEEMEDEEKPVSKKGGNKQAKKKKKKKELHSAMDSDENAQQQIDVKGKTSASELESEDEDGFPVSLSVNGESRFAKLQANKIADKGKIKNDTKQDSESASNLKRKVDAMDHDQEPKSDAIEGDVFVENKKKKNKKNKKKAKIEDDALVAKIKQNEGEVANVKQDGDKEEKKMMSETVKETKQSKAKPGKIRTYSNGLIVEEMEMGKPNGTRASPGKKVSVNYIGKLKTGKVFDSSSGSPYKFRLGIGQVIKGWDVGVEGMRVGDKRRLTVPPAMGYDSTSKPPEVPPNAWLVFDVELVDVA